MAAIVDMNDHGSDCSLKLMNDHENEHFASVCIFLVSLLVAIAPPENYVAQNIT
jgi:hypothetical protein